MPAGVSGPEQRLWLRPEVLDDIVGMLERGSGDGPPADALVSRGALRSDAGGSLDPYIDALQDKIVWLIYGDVPDDARELDRPAEP